MQSQPISEVQFSKFPRPPSRLKNFSRRFRFRHSSIAEFFKPPSFSSSTVFLHKIRGNAFYETPQMFYETNKLVLQFVIMTRGSVKYGVPKA